MFRGRAQVHPEPPQEEQPGGEGGQPAGGGGGGGGGQPGGGDGGYGLAFNVKVGAIFVIGFIVLMIVILIPLLGDNHPHQIGDTPPPSQSPSPLP